MSNALAIAAVTRTLRTVINTALQQPLPPNLPADVQPTAQIAVTTLPLDKVRVVNETGNVVNLYLYSTVPNPTYRNAPLPRSGGGSGGEPPLALNLHYMVTAFGEGDSELIAHLLLGRAMLALHDNALLMPADLSDALAASALQSQVERVRVTPHSMGFEEISKLWMAYQTQYRISATYEAAVVLIDSARTPKIAPPVRAANVVVAPFQRPQVAQLTPQVALPGAVITLTGTGLGDPSTQVLVGGQLVAPGSLSDRTLVFTLPAGVSAGVNTVQVVQNVPLGVPPVAHPGVGFESNLVAFMLSPLITTAAPVSVARGAVLQLAVSPPVAQAQRVLLLLGDQQIALPPPAAGDPPTTGLLSFPIPSTFAAGSYLMRVQVDGAASLLTTDTAPASPTFNRYIGPLANVT